MLASISEIVKQCEKKAELGDTSTKANLYKQQIAVLSEDCGFSIKKISCNFGKIRQYHCSISWRDAKPGTVAHSLLMIAAGNNGKLCMELPLDSSKPVDPPYNRD